MYVQDQPITLLSELRPLTRQDLVKNGKRVMPSLFYIQSFYREDVLEEHRIDTPIPNFIERYLPWLQAKRVFIPKEKEPITEPTKDLLI